MSLVMNQQKSYIFGLLGIFLSLMFFSCKTAKLSDAEEKHRIGEYYEAAAIYRKVYTKTSPKKRDLRGYIAFRMAECNRLINSTDKAISGYMNALRYEYPDSILNLRLGQMLQRKGRYTEAIKQYDAYLMYNPESQLLLMELKVVSWLLYGRRIQPVMKSDVWKSSIPAVVSFVRC